MAQNKKKYDPTTIRASLVLAAIEEFRHQLGIVAEVQTEHGKKLDKIDVLEGKFNKLNNDMDSVKYMLKQHGKKLDEHTKILNEHSKTLNFHSKILNEHSKILNEHSRDLKLLKTDMAFMKNELVKFVQHEEIYVLEQRILALEKRTN